jgi:hypothetical protein
MAAEVHPTNWHSSNHDVRGLGESQNALIARLQLEVLPKVLEHGTHGFKDVVRLCFGPEA